VKILDTWLEIIRTEEQRTELRKEEDWNIAAMGTINKGG